MTVTQMEWDARAAERQAAADGNPAAWHALFGWLWVWSAQVAGSEDGAMAGWEKVVNRPSVWLKSLEYFAQIFINAGRDYARWERRHQRRLAALYAALNQEPRRSNQNRQSELMCAIKEAFVKLPSEVQRVMELYLEQDLSIAQISVKTAVPETTVRRRVRIAVAAIREVLRDGGGESGLPAPAA